MTTRRAVLGTLAAAGGAGLIAALHGDRAVWRLPPDAADHCWLDRAAAAYQARYDVPALSVAIGRAERILYAKAWGDADREVGEAVTPAYRFRIASISKPLTAVGIFTLLEQGRVRLEDRVFGEGSVLGTRFGAPPYPRYVEAVTIAHLLSHSAGGWSTDDPEPAVGPLDHTRLIRWALLEAPLQHAPGTQFAYSNIGYVMLARVIEALTGQDYAAWLRETVLARGGISDIMISGSTLWQRQPEEVRYYQSDENPYAVNLPLWDAAAGWIASPRDLLRFVMCVDAMPGSDDILWRPSIWRMTTASPVNPHYALGWRIDSAGGWFHTGFLPGLSAVVMRAADGLCWAACVNARRPASRLDVDLRKLVAAMARRVDTWRPT